MNGFPPVTATVVPDVKLERGSASTYIPTAPAGLVALLNAPDAESFDVSSLRVVITGGASAAVETIREYQKRMKGHLIELYGMLEAGFQTYTRFTDDPQKVNGTIGRPVRAMELRIIDGQGNDVPPLSEAAEWQGSDRS